MKAGFIAEFDMFLDVCAVKMKIFDRVDYTWVRGAFLSYNTYIKSCLY